MSEDEPGYWVRKAAEDAAGRGTDGAATSSGAVFNPQSSTPSTSNPPSRPSFPGYPTQPGPYANPLPPIPVAAPGYPPPPAMVQPHPSATTAFVLGLVAVIGALPFFGLPLVVAPFAWGIGAKSLREIRASQGRLSGEGNARAGMVLGIIGTVLLIVAIVLLMLLIMFVVDLSNDLVDQNQPPGIEV